MTKEEFIEKYGEEAWVIKNEQSKLWQKQNRESIRERNRQYNRDFYAKNRETVSMKESIVKKREALKNKMGECAKFAHTQYLNYIHTKIESWVTYVLENLQKEASEFDGDSRFTDINFLYERFVDNVNNNLVFGNIQIIKYFIPIMCIKLYNNETFTEHEIEMLKYFDSMEETKKKPIKYSFLMIYMPKEYRSKYDQAIKYMVLYNIIAKYTRYGVIYPTDKKLY